MATEKFTSLRTKASMQSVPFIRTREDDPGLLKTLRYEEAEVGKPPIPVTVAPPRDPPTDTHPALRGITRSLAHEDSAKRDSGLAPATTMAERESSIVTVGSAPGSSIATLDASTTAPMTPITPQRNGSWNSSAANKLRKTGDGGKIETLPKTPENVYEKTIADEEFSPITTPIPTDDQLELNFMDEVTFSHRGSVFLGGMKAVNNQLRPEPGRSKRKPSMSMLEATISSSLSAELELESQKVRSMYETGGSLDWEDGSPSIAAQLQSSDPKLLRQSSQSSVLCAPSANSNLRPESALSRREVNTGSRMEHEMAGGLEDWEDVSGEDVDRYGFITARKSPATSNVIEPRAPQRVSTALQLASDTPRKRRGFGRTLSSAKSNRSIPQRIPSRKISARSLNTQATSASKRSPSKSFRQARNRLPGNADRRWMDEAGDMLTLPPGLADIAEDEENGQGAAEDVRRKEYIRTEKWRKMAKMVKSGAVGEGMSFEFDVKNPKLIERTWKGIPDRWRATAWYSFLSASAKKVKGSPTDHDIITSFHSLLEQSSADDVQIDMDVPRTINSHIMFRRRYRGGQRLLFRVLHSLSLHFPGTGYVQGMASLAATLLCYYDEEKCFVMLVRMWTLRSLDKLYAPGFAGLMSALDEFKQGWMNGHDVSRRLDELGIDPTAYGTRWYLTLFNYSIPFPAQLRVWDVFMLLGDADPLVATTAERPFASGLDILHSASCALIDGTREILLDSDFENAMKVLTSWVPIKDEELFMKVAKAEWRLHRNRKLKV